MKKNIGVMQVQGCGFTAKYKQALILPWRFSSTLSVEKDRLSTASTGISKLGFNRMVQDKIANHIDKTVGGIYDRHDYMKEKRAALEAWERKLKEILFGQVASNVVPFHKSA